MAELIKTVVGYHDVGTNVTFTSATADGDYIDFAGYKGFPDQRVMFIVRNQDSSHDAIVTFKAGDGILSAQGDVAVTVPKSSEVAIPLTKLDTARIKVTSGENKGKILVNSSIASGGDISSVQIAVICVK